MTYTRTSLANRALDIVSKDTELDIDAATSATGKLVLRNYDAVFKRCLRKAQWPWAIKRMALNPSADEPVNEFTYAFDLPSGFEKLIRIWPSRVPYKREGRQILCDENAITIKYIDNAAIQDPSVIDSDFAEYFAHELAAAIIMKVTDSVALRKEVRDLAKERFTEAAALFSQEDTDDAIEESPWITVRDTDDYENGTIRIEGLE